MPKRTCIATLVFALMGCVIAAAETKPIATRSNVLEESFMNGPALSTIHFRPETGRFGDVIPFYWQGNYHVFYLHGSAWGHLATRDFVKLA